MDVHGNDNTPEWGLCETPGCSEPAEPLWFSGGFPDDPDLLLCYRHTGEHIGKLQELARQAVYGLWRWKRNQKRGGSRYEAEHGMTDLGQAASDFAELLGLD